jgi:hypothetical protein
MNGMNQENSQQIVFEEDFYLNATAGNERWNEVSILDERGIVEARFVFSYQEKLGLRTIGMPPLVPVLGPWINPQVIESKSHDYIYELVSKIIAKLPRFDHFDQSFHHSRSDWLAWYWAGFEQTSYYTHLLTRETTASLFDSLRENTKRSLDKAQRKNSLTCQIGVPFPELFSVLENSYARQHLGNLSKMEMEPLTRLHQALIQNNRGTILGITNPKGQVLAATLLVWDSSFVYYLRGGVNSSSINTGAGTMAIWESIKFAHNMHRVFDFEGSMVKSINHFFRGFRPIPTPYSRISHSTSKYRLHRRASNLSRHFLGI